MTVTEKFLSQDEVDALLKGVTGETDEAKEAIDPSIARSYDLATQERIVRGRMPTLELIHERFARLFRVGLYNLLRRTAEVVAGPVRVSKYSEFLRHLSVPTNLNLVQIRPLRGTGLIVMDPELVYLLVDNFFGGDGRFVTRIEGRDFTPTELRTIRRVLGIVFEGLEKSWESVQPVQYEYVRSEMHTQFANIATPNEVVVSTSFKVEIGDRGGSLHLCVPYIMIEPLRDLLSSALQGETMVKDTRWVGLMRQQIQDAEVEARANFAVIHTTIGELMDYQVGDIIPIVPPDTVTLTVDAIPLMECQYGQVNGQIALKVREFISRPATEPPTGATPGATP